MERERHVGTCGHRIEDNHSLVFILGGDFPVECFLRYPNSCYGHICRYFADILIPSQFVAVFVHVRRCGGFAALNYLRLAEQCAVLVTEDNRISGFLIALGRVVQIALSRSEVDVYLVNKGFMIAVGQHEVIAQLTIRAIEGIDVTLDGRSDCSATGRVLRRTDLEGDVAILILAVITDYNRVNLCRITHIVVYISHSVGIVCTTELHHLGAYIFVELIEVINITAYNCRTR